MTLIPRTDVEDALGTRILDAFAFQHGYQATLPDLNGAPIPNPETKLVFFRRKIREFVKESVKAAEVSQAAESARVTAATKADTEITL